MLFLKFALKEGQNFGAACLIEGWGPTSQSGTAAHKHRGRSPQGLIQELILVLYPPWELLSLTVPWWSTTLRAFKVESYHLPPVKNDAAPLGLSIMIGSVWSYGPHQGYRTLMWYYVCCKQDEMAWWETSGIFFRNRLRNSNVSQKGVWGTSPRNFLKFWLKMV